MAPSQAAADARTMKKTAQDALEIATRETRRRIRRLARKAPSSLKPFYDEVGEQLTSYPVDAVRVRARLTPGVSWPPRESLGAYVEGAQLSLVQLALHLAGTAVPTGRMAMGVGIESFKVYGRICRSTTGKKASYVRRPSRILPSFGTLTWHGFVHSTLPEDDVRILGRRLGELYPEAFVDGLPSAREVRRRRAEEPPGEVAPRGGAPAAPQSRPFGRPHRRNARRQRPDAATSLQGMDRGFARGRPRDGEEDPRPSRVRRLAAR